jgi:hypothetical protein
MLLVGWCKRFGVIVWGKTCWVCFFAGFSQEGHQLAKRD